MQVKWILQNQVVLRKYVSMLVVSMAPLFSIAQTIYTGSIASLRMANGFKGIILGSDISQLSGSVSYLDGDSSADEDGCIKYLYNDQAILKMNANLMLDLVGLRTYKNKIVDIYLFFNEKDAYKILAAFLRQYGQYTAKPVEYADIYNWNTGDLTLTLKYDPDIDEGVAIFTCTPLKRAIADEKMKLEQMAQIIALVNLFIKPVIGSTP